MNVYYIIIYGTGFLILYAYRALHRVTAHMPNRKKWTFRMLFLLISVFIYATTTYLAVNREDYEGQEWVRTYTVAGAVTLAVTLLCMSIIQVVSDLVQSIRWLIKSRQEEASGNDEQGRRTFLSKLALGVGAVVFGSFIWGTTKGKFGWRLMSNRLRFDNLPKAFDGLKIVQISDFHLGSFNDNYEPIQEAIELINAQEPDYIFFTGDLVNEEAAEGEAWIDIIRGLKAKHGKYAILGNHDYGWGSDITEAERTEKSHEVIAMLKRMQLKVLANEHEVLVRDGEKIGLVGVENWGYSEKNWFPMRGDYEASTRGMEDVPFEILLSHDPTHWDHHIVGKEQVDLTLSGHTHGGQMGIRIPGLVEISAGRLFYKRYAGLYTENNQQLYVNRGMGYLIFPGRVGMPPEITVHELSCSV